MLRAFGASLRSSIARGTSNRALAALVGAVATVAVQSSTATAVITSSFAARALISGVMAQAVMLGANVGTAIAAALLSLDIHWLSPLMILLGVAIFSRARQAKGKGIGRALLGLGLMLLALDLLGQATEPIRASAAVISALSSLGEAPVLGLLFGAILAFLASSSLAVVLFVALLAGSGVVSPLTALVLVAGANLGGAVPPYIAVLAEGAEARRIAATNLGIRALGAVVVTVLAPWLAPLLSGIWPDTAQMALASHFAFSAVLLLLFLPILGPVTRGAERLVPSSTAQRFGPQYLDDTALSTPAIAISLAARETLRLGDLVNELLSGSLRALQGNDPADRDRLVAIERDIDTLYGAIKSYLAALGREGLDEDDVKRAGEVMSYAVNLEHVGDIIDSGLVDLAAKKARRSLSFSAEGLAEITSFYHRTLDILQTAQSVFLTRDADLARQLVHAKVDVRRLETNSAERHLERLRAQRTETIETSGMHLDVLRDLKRVNAHLISVAYPILDDLGALGESRLKPLDGER